MFSHLYIPCYIPFRLLCMRRGHTLRHKAKIMWKGNIRCENPKHLCISDPRLPILDGLQNLNLQNLNFFLNCTILGSKFEHINYF